MTEERGAAVGLLRRFTLPTLLPVLLLSSLIACSANDRGNGRTKVDNKDPADQQIQPEFLKVLAPTSGDEGAAGLLAIETAATKSSRSRVADCMAKSGYRDADEIGRLEQAERLHGHSFFTSPAKLEKSGFVSVSDPRLEAIPLAERQAWADCAGESPDVKGSARVKDFSAVRDSSQNPFENWEQGVVAVEMRKIAQSSDVQFDDYRQCFLDLGIPADVAKDPSKAFQWGLTEMNQRLRPGNLTTEAIDRWASGEGVLDPDGGALARSFANCWRTFETHLTPVLVGKRDRVVDTHREQLFKVQREFDSVFSG